MKSTSGEKKKAVFGLPDYLIFFICAAGVAVCIWLFQRDFNQSLSRTNETPVGTISWKHKAAQRRFSDRVIWDRLQKESPIYNGDLIRTADLSEATITFRHGEVIDLAENSIIQIYEENAMPHIDLSQGGIAVNASDTGSGGLILSFGDNTVDITPGASISAGSGEDGNFALRVSEGSAVLNTASGTVQVSAGYAVALDSEGREDLSPQAVPLTPRQTTRYLHPRREPMAVNFTWNKVNYSGVETTLLEIAEDRGFTRVIESRNIDGNSIAVDLAAGTWWWRIYAVTEMNTTIPVNIQTGRLVIMYSPPPELITPAEDYTYTYRTKHPAVRFHWTETPEASFYILEASVNPDMSDPVLQTEVKGGSLTYSRLNAARYYWRVRPVFAGEYEGFPPASAVRPFIIQQTGELTAPNLTAPAAGETIITGAGRQEAYFSWKPDPEADSYTIRVAAVPNLENPVITKRVHDNFYLYPVTANDLQEGQYYWGVYKTDLEGNDSPVSAIRPFAAREREVILRTTFPPDNYSIAENLLSETRFTWRTNLTGQKRFQISPDNNFSNFLLNETVSEEFIQAQSLPPGNYYWRISADDGGATQETPTRRFTILAPILPPLPLEPPEDAALSVSPNGAVRFLWRPAETAEYYQFRVYPEEDRGRAVYEGSVTGTEASAAASILPSGNYYWTVQGFSYDTAASTRRTGRVMEARFSILETRPVELVSPAHGASFTAAEAARNPVRIQWDSPEEIGASRFILSRSPNPLSGAPVIERRNPARIIPLNALTPGLYYWTVEAQTRDGRDVSAGTVFSFRVIPPPPLPAPGNQTPASGTVYGPAQLAALTEIRFSWNTAQGANAYIFVLRREINGRSRDIVRTQPLPETSHSLTDLTILDVGTFIWEVEAVIVRRDGSIERRGEVRRNTFTIDIPLPRNPEYYRMEPLYGR